MSERLHSHNVSILNRTLDYYEEQKKWFENTRRDLTGRVTKLRYVKPSSKWKIKEVFVETQLRVQPPSQFTIAEDFVYKLKSDKNSDRHLSTEELVAKARAEMILATTEKSA